ncbi:hypothetical protein Angca_000137, partial [Angiostrongylus cantonensis]
SANHYRAVSVVRCAVATDYAFGVDDLELMDHVYACILNTSHYDESVIEVGARSRVISGYSSLLFIVGMHNSIYAHANKGINLCMNVVSGGRSQFGEAEWTSLFHESICLSISTSNFRSAFTLYLWSAAVQLWKPFELDRLDILCSWSYLALQFSDTVDDDTMELIETAKCQAAHVLATTIVVENTHQANQRIATVERNLKETKALAEKIGKKVI